MILPTCVTHLKLVINSGLTFEEIGPAVIDFNILMTDHIAFLTRTSN